ncbi:GTP cyclohydrolase II [Actibacterium sp. 188UL27-1]|uniref:GTP cyclohydrolase II n=1 Tax=Actibacterium sp. 188UL27-1 TaxID=2786961 RepID=UPI00195B8A1C|nr:GTP cyclohydrolase II [Actibacterium sp. 188UL27-1]MBM7069776.1 GTP cyclohydrolase II [Actibacterium sp. 188UL27-1]
MPTTSDCLLPTLAERLARARSDLAMGLPCLLTHQGNRAVIIAVEPLSQARFEALQQRLGTPELILTAQRAQAIMPAVGDIDDPLVRLHPPASAGFEWFKDLSDPQLDADRRPAGPLHMIRSLQTPLHGLSIKLVKLAELLPAVAIFTVEDDANLDDLPFATLVADQALEALLIPPALAQVSAAALPLEAHDLGRLQIFRDPDGGKEHYAIEIGTPDRNQPVLARVHSACFTGDVLGSLKCDCGPQLRAALARMGQEGSGVLLYLNQEGRGIGLANKMRAYALQAQGLDTVEANHRIGYDDDERDFRVAAGMLRALGFSAIRLLTNNPAKVQTFHDGDVAVVEQLPLRVGRNMHNQDYLSVKALKSGHSL